MAINNNPFVVMLVRPSNAVGEKSMTILGIVPSMLETLSDQHDAKYDSRSCISPAGGYGSAWRGRPQAYDKTLARPSGSA